MSDQLVRSIFEHIVNGKLDKTAGIELLKQLNKEGHQAEKDDIAIIGMAGRFPDADNVQQFWDNLQSGKDSIRPFPDDRRRDVEGLKQFTYMRDKEVSFSKAGYLNRIDDFDYKFFGISPKEASLMDPNQRLFLQIAWHALEEAGYGGRNITSTRTGIYIGYSGWPMYGQFVSYTDPESFDMSVSGNISAIIARRVPQLLDLRGASMLVDTACSSSLVALHMACKAIASGDCDQALVGGLRLTLLPLEGYVKYGIESSDSRAKAFDDQADGTALSESIAVLVIKPLKHALRDQDEIHAVIKGSAINQDGTSISITAPNGKAQEEVILRAWEDANIDPTTISYIEAFGSGTKLGDPIEIDAIQKAFRKYTDKRQFCAIGSLKSNIGHTDAAAGLSGVIKAVLSMKHKQIPPSLHFQFPNRQIAFEQSPVYVNDQLSVWEQQSFPRRCGVSSFGFSGTNCHIVLEEAPKPIVRSDVDIQSNKTHYLFTVSAKSQTALSQLIDDYVKLLQQQVAVNLDELCYSAAVCRGHYTYRLAAWVSSVDELTARLQAYRERKDELVELENLLVGHHKIIPASRANATRNLDTDVTEGEVRERTEQAGSIMKKLGEVDSSEERILLHKLASLYVGGANLDWTILYSDHRPRKMRIPVYPFEPSRCWLNVPEIQSKPHHKLATFGESDYYRSLVAAGQSNLDLSNGELDFGHDEQAIISFEVTEPIFAGIRDLAQSCGTSLQSVVLAVYQILLSKYTGMTDIAVGLLLQQPQEIVTPVRNKPEGYKTIEYYIKEVAASYEYAAAYSREALEAWIGLKSNEAGAKSGRLFDAGFATVTDLRASADLLQAGFALSLLEQSNLLSFVLQVKSNSMHTEIKDRFVEDLLYLLEQSAVNKHGLIQELSLPTKGHAFANTVPDDFDIDF